MDCKFYTSCKKDHTCPYLGECVFGHPLVAKNYSPQAVVSLHYAPSAKSVLNTFRAIKRKAKFNGFVGDAAEHIKKLRKKRYTDILPETELPLKAKRKRVTNVAREMRNLSAEVHKKINLPKPTTEYLQSQTVEQFIEKRRIEEIVKKQLALPEPNFHY